MTSPALATLMPNIALAWSLSAVQAALATDDVKRIWQEQGARIDLQSREAFAGFVAREVERWSAIARTTGLPME